MQFSLCVQFKYTTNTSSLLKTSPMTLTCSRSVAIYVSSVVHMLGTLQLLGTSQSTLECPWSTRRFPVSSWRCKSVWDRAVLVQHSSKDSRNMHCSQCAFDFLAWVFGLPSGVAVNFCNRKGRRFVPPTRSGVTAPCVTLTFWQKIASVSLQVSVPGAQEDLESAQLRTFDRQII